MTLVRYEPWTFMNRLHRDLDNLLGEAPAATLAAAATAPQPTAIVPRVDVHDEAQRYVIRADLPGVAPADIDVTTEQGLLTLRAERRAAVSAEATPNGATRIERSHGVYQRRFTLPEDAALDAIAAKYEHGVLELVIPKQAKVQPRRINVNVAAA